ncbi:MAG: nuclear transport factor 2 family protein [Myxococcota bacterium]|nr:nuclear transport factor 2 family protein [Myxococcota bacterium]
MALTLQEISDRLEIQDLLVRYSHCIDTQNIDALDDIFTPDAFIDYSAFGGSTGDLEHTKAFLKKSLAIFKSSQHMISNIMLEIDGDTATGRTICHNPMVLGKGDEENVFVCGLWYVDELVRTDAGWRIRKRSEDRSFIDGMPESFEVAK